MTSENESPRKVPIPAEKARGGHISGRVITVLSVSLLLGVVAIAAIMLWFQATHPGANSTGTPAALPLSLVAAPIDFGPRHS